MIRHYLIRQRIITEVIFRVKSHHHSPFISIFQSHLASRRTVEFTEKFAQVVCGQPTLVLMLCVSSGSLQLDGEILKASTPG